jgi:hypothetical protein
MYDCETLCLLLREESTLRLSKKKFLRRIFGPERVKIGNGKGLMMRNFIVSTVHIRYSGGLNIQNGDGQM